MSDKRYGLAGAAVLVGFGALEGASFLLTGMLNPRCMATQMRFESFVVMKMFISGVATSLLSHSLLSILPATSADFEKQRTSTAPNTLLRICAGSTLVGVGMFLSGAGPTMFPSYLVAVRSSLPLLFGALAGAAAWGVAEKQGLVGAPSCAVPAAAASTPFLDKRLGVPFAAVAAPMGVGLLAAAVALDVAHPHARDSAMLGTRVGFALSPILAGVVVGLGQLPLRVLAGRGQGGSSAVQSIVATATGGAISPKFAVGGVGTKNFSQLAYVWGGTTLGCVAAMALGTYAGFSANPPLWTFAGGFLTMWGARMAGGCTCGHGITGVSELALPSFAAAACIFGGGMATAAALKGVL